MPQIDPQDKGKGIFIPKVKKSDFQSHKETFHFNEAAFEERFNQIKTDEEIARIIQQEWEDEEKELRKEKLKKQKLSSQFGVKKKRKFTLKQAGDRAKFIEFLKSIGFNGKQLYPMHTSNLADLYYKEKRQYEDMKKKKDAEIERAVQWALKMGTTVVHQGKIYNPGQSSKTPVSESSSQQQVKQTKGDSTDKEKSDKKQQVSSAQLEESQQFKVNTMSNAIDKEKEPEKKSKYSKCIKSWKRRKAIREGLKKIYKRLHKRLMKQKLKKEQGKIFVSYCLKKYQKVLKTKAFKRFIKEREQGG